MRRAVAIGAAGVAMAGLTAWGAASRGAGRSEWRKRSQTADGGAPGAARGRVDSTGSWYLANRSRIVREVRFAIPHYRKLFVDAYGKEEGRAIVRDTMQRFEALLPGLPYIGGASNPLTRTLYLTAAMLAMYRSLTARGASAEEAARLIYLGTGSFYNSFPSRLMLRWSGRQHFGRKRIDQRRRDAAVSRERRYPDDWVFDIVEGDGHAFEWGVDYTECGIVKYLSREGAPELAPYLCWIDYPVFAAMRVKLTRTETIAQGCQRCDFRFSRGRPVEIKPDFLAEGRAAVPGPS